MRLGRLRMQRSKKNMLCEKYTPENSFKRCSYKEIDGTTKCYELYKKCSDYNSEETKNKEFCEAIEEDSYHKCVFNTEDSSSTCVNTQNKCEDYNSKIDECNLVQLNDTYKCKYDNSEGKCDEIAKNCSLYTGKDRLTYENIDPP